MYSLGLGKHHTKYCKLLSGVLYIRLEKSFYLQSPGTCSIFRVCWTSQGVFHGINMNARNEWYHTEEVSFGINQISYHINALVPTLADFTLQRWQNRSASADLWMIGSFFFFFFTPFTILQRLLCDIIPFWSKVLSQQCRQLTPGQWESEHEDSNNT